MLFRRHMPPECATCSRATRLSEHDMICTRSGIVHESYKCRHYRYDPLKRTPLRRPPIKGLDEGSGLSE